MKSSRSHRCIVDVDREDFILGVMSLELQGSRHLDEFACQRPARGMNDARNLHRDRRSTRYNAAVPNPLESRTNQGDGIHSRMPAEHPVFVANKRVQVEGRYLIQQNRMPPDVIIAPKGAQSRAVTRYNHRSVWRVSSRRRKRETPV